MVRRRAGAGGAVPPGWCRGPERSATVTVLAVHLAPGRFERFLQLAGDQTQLSLVVGGDVDRGQPMPPFVIPEIAVGPGQPPGHLAEGDSLTFAGSPQPYAEGGLGRDAPRRGSSPVSGVGCIVINSCGVAERVWHDDAARWVATAERTVW